jgi:hypothetical protein
LVGFDNGTGEASTRLGDLFSSLRDATKNVFRCRDNPVRTQGQLRRDVGIEQSKLLRHGEPELCGGSVLGGQLALGCAHCPAIRRSPRGRSEVAAPEDEPSWLVQFDRLGVRLPAQAY